MGAILTDISRLSLTTYQQGIARGDITKIILRFPYTLSAWHQARLILLKMNNFLFRVYEITAITYKKFFFAYLDNLLRKAFT